ncbi:uncharacterized protein EAE97_005255 [Botrytis byssoidea]|uniref:Uncharacterized protein n=1 Tax=Botrytis byssoidea TaxID=139641 RepID=A0A9P5INV9_9HELO|nr:uncharacterized protein EAE97_005255 [Botrytis byssoidea]KAF7944622.1 hypothetical protein EAE97_005255 [Botrytis byssoidea]
MKYLLFYLILAVISCLLHIYLFSYTLPSLHQKPTDTLHHHSPPCADHRSPSGSSPLELEFHTKDAHDKSPQITKSITGMTTSAEEKQKEKSVPTTGYWFGGYRMALREMIMIVAVGNPLVLGGVVGLVIALFRMRYGGLIGG